MTLVTVLVFVTGLLLHEAQGLRTCVNRDCGTVGSSHATSGAVQRACRGWGLERRIGSSVAESAFPSAPAAYVGSLDPTATYVPTASPHPPAPGGLTCKTASEVFAHGGITYTVNVTGVNSTVVPNGCGVYPGNGLWFKYRAPVDLTLYITTCQNETLFQNDTAISMYASCDDAEPCAQFNDEDSAVWALYCSSVTQARIVTDIINAGSWVYFYVQENPMYSNGLPIFLEVEGCYAACDHRAGCAGYTSLDCEMCAEERGYGGSYGNQVPCVNACPTGQYLGKDPPYPWGAFQCLGCPNCKSGTNCTGGVCTACDETGGFGWSLGGLPPCTASCPSGQFMDATSPKQCRLDSTSPSDTASISDTSSITPSLSVTSSLTSSPSLSPSLTPSPSVTPSTTASNTPTTSPSASPISISATTSASISFSPTTSVSGSPSITPSLTPTTTPSQSPDSPSSSLSPSLSPSSSPLSITASPTTSPSLTPSPASLTPSISVVSVSATTSVIPSPSATPGSGAEGLVSEATAGSPAKGLGFGEIAAAVIGPLFACCVGAAVVFAVWRWRAKKKRKEERQQEQRKGKRAQRSYSTDSSVMAHVRRSLSASAPPLRSSASLSTTSDTISSSPSQASSATGGPNDRVWTWPETLFISYGRSDNATPLARQLKEDLHNRGYTVWLDENNIHSGANFMDAIGRAVEGCAAMIAFLDKKYVKSQFCKDELHLARVEGKILLPCFLEDVRLPADLKYPLSCVNWTRFDKDPYEVALDKLVRGMEDVHVFRKWDHEIHAFLPRARRDAIVALLTLRRRKKKSDKFVYKTMLRRLDDAVVDRLCFFIGGGTRRDECA